MLITNYNSYLGKPRLTLTRNGNTLTVQTFGYIPSNLILCICYSTLAADHRSRGRHSVPAGSKDFRNCHHKRRKMGRMHFTSRGDYVNRVYTNSTYTFPLLTPRRWGHLRPEDRIQYRVRAELRRRYDCFGERTRYVSNILSVFV